MPIIKEHNLLFIHIPKTGGSSIEKAFNVFGNNEFWGTTEKCIDGINMAPQHYTPEVLKDILGKEYNSYLKFTFVRNPYARIISEYKYKNKIDFVYKKNLNEWIPKYLAKIDTDHKLPQSVFVDETVDFVGHTESLEDDLNKFLSKICITIKLSHDNKTIGNSLISSHLINKSNLQLINKVYEQDFQRFGYSIRDKNFFIYELLSTTLNFVIMKFHALKGTNNIYS